MTLFSTFRRIRGPILLIGMIILGAGSAAVAAHHWGWNLRQLLTPSDGSSKPGATAMEPTAGAVASRPMPPLPVLDRVHALGRLEPKGRLIRLASPSGNEGARVEQLLVHEGDDVEADQVVARLDTYARREAELLQAQSERETARSRLEQTLAGAKPGDIAAQEQAVELQKQQLVVAQHELDRAERLVQLKTMSREEFENRRWARDKVVLEQRRAEEQLASLKEVRKVDVQVQERLVAAAEAAVRTAEARKEASQIRTRRAGKVLRIHTRAGEKIGDLGLLELGQVNEMQAVAEVYEGDVLELAVGLPATVKLDSSGETFTGQVDEIGLMIARKVVLTNDPVSDTDARVLEVRVGLNPQDSRRLSRMSNARVEVSIQLPQRDRP